MEDSDKLLNEGERKIRDNKRRPCIESINLPRHKVAAVTRTQTKARGQLTTTQACDSALFAQKLQADVFAQVKGSHVASKCAANKRECTFVIVQKIKQCIET